MKKEKQEERDVLVIDYIKETHVYERINFDELDDEIKDLINYGRKSFYINYGSENMNMADFVSRDPNVNMRKALGDVCGEINCREQRKQGVAFGFRKYDNYSWGGMIHLLIKDAIRIAKSINANYFLWQDENYLGVLDINGKEVLNLSCKK